MRKIFPVWDLRLLMRLLPESVFTQTQITESAAECCILFCRLREGYLSSEEQLFTRCARLLGVDESYMEKHLMDMVIDRKLVLKESGETIVYPAQYYYLELNTARMLNELNIVCPEDKRACQAQN